MNPWCLRCVEMIENRCGGFSGQATPRCHTPAQTVPGPVDPHTGCLFEAAGIWPADGVEHCRLPGREAVIEDLHGDGQATVESAFRIPQSAIPTSRGFSSFSPAVACCDQAAKASLRDAMQTGPAVSPRRRPVLFFPVARNQNPNQNQNRDVALASHGCAQSRRQGCRMDPAKIG